MEGIAHMGAKRPNLSALTWDIEIDIRIFWLYESREYCTMIPHGNIC